MNIDIHIQVLNVFKKTACLLLLSFAPQVAAGGNIVGNGAGLAEMNVIQAYWRLLPIIDQCLSFDSCYLNSQEKTILSRIGDNLREHQLEVTNIKFVSGSLEPNFFVIEGLVRVAKTSTIANDVIYINTDMLYHLGADGAVVPMDMFSAMALLIHELGHQTGEVNHALLDGIGAKVHVFQLRYLHKIDLGREQRQFAISIIDGSAANPWPSMLVEDGLTVIDMSNQLRTTVKCPDGTDPNGMQLHNLHWNHNFSGVFVLQSVMARADAILACRSDLGEWEEISSMQMTFSIPLHFEGSRKYRIGQEAVKIRQIDCHRNEWLCYVKY